MPRGAQIAQGLVARSARTERAPARLRQRRLADALTRVAVVVFGQRPRPGLCRFWLKLNVPCGTERCARRCDRPRHRTVQWTHGMERLQPLQARSDLILLNGAGGPVWEPAQKSTMSRLPGPPDPEPVLDGPETRAPRLYPRRNTIQLLLPTPRLSPACSQLPSAASLESDLRLAVSALVQPTGLRSARRIG